MRTIFNYRIIIAFLVGCQGYAACKVSRDIAIPDTGLPAHYNQRHTGPDSVAGMEDTIHTAVSGMPDVTDTTGIADMPWQDFFTDTTLKALIADALAHNFDLQVAVKNIEAAQLTLRQAKLGNIPTLDVQAAASLSRPSDNSLNGLSLSQYLHSTHVEDYTLAASLSWEADIWGKIRSQKAAALAGYLQTGEARKTVQTQIVSDVSKGYYNLLMLDAQLTIARRNVLLNDSTLHIIQLQYGSGQVTSLAIQQALAQKLTAQALIPSFEQQIVIQENAISILSGRMPAPVAHNSPLESVVFAEKLSAGLPSALLSRRPDVKLSELALSKENANVGYARANMYPSLTVTAQGGLDAFKASNWFNIPASLFGAVAGSLTQPLFRQRKLRTLWDLAKVTRDQSVIRFRQSVLVAVGEVSDALVKLDKLKYQQELIADRTGTLQEATHNAQLLFANGLATYLEVITAQSNVLQSELELAGIKKNRLDAVVDLYRSVGGGWN